MPPNEQFHGMYWLYVYLMSINGYLQRLFESVLCRPRSTHPDKFLSPVQIPVATKFKRQVAEPGFLRRPSRFRAGIVATLVRNRPLAEAAGMHLVTALKGRLSDVYRKYDRDLNNTLDSSELAAIFADLGLEVSEVLVAFVMCPM